MLYMRADSETNFRKIAQKISKKILTGNSKEAPNLNNSEEHIISFEDIFGNTRNLFEKSKPALGSSEEVHGKVCWLIA